MSGKGYGCWDSVHAPLTLITAFGRVARSSTLGRSAQGCGGAGGGRGWPQAPRGRGEPGAGGGAGKGGAAAPFPPDSQVYRPAVPTAAPREAAERRVAGARPPHLCLAL